MTRAQDKFSQRDYAPDDKPPGNGSAGPQRFKLQRFADIRISTKPNYLIKGFLPRKGLAVMWGPHKCGKSFIAFDMAMHIALGRPYRDRRVQQGAVAYLALEGGGGFPARVEVWRQRHLGDSDDAAAVPFYLLNNVAVDLNADHAELVAAIREQMPEPPAAIFIDTVNRALNGDENSPVDMGRFIRSADALAAAFQALIVLIHHCGVAGNRPRGHTSLSGADDVEISVAKAVDGLITVSVDHMKDGPVLPPFGARIESACAGVDTEGDLITSCVVVPAAASTRARAPFNANQGRFLDILREAALDVPATPLELQGTDKVPHDVVAVTRDTLKKYCLIKGWLDDADTGNSRAKLSNMLNTLAGKKLIGLTDRFVWLIT
jgi:hypothetical protein